MTQWLTIQHAFITPLCFIALEKVSIEPQWQFHAYH